MHAEGSLSKPPLRRRVCGTPAARLHACGRRVSMRACVSSCTMTGLLALAGRKPVVDTAKAGTLVAVCSCG